MNITRRKQINSILEQISGLRSELESVNDEEQDAFDNLPESFQEGERGERIQAALDAIDTAFTAFDDIESALNEAIE